MEAAELSEMEKAILMRLFDKCGFSTKCHIPEEAFLRGLLREKMGKEARKEIKKSFRKLINKGYIGVKKTGRSRETYSLTRRGVRVVKEILRELERKLYESFV